MYKVYAVLDRIVQWPSCPINGIEKSEWCYGYTLGLEGHNYPASGMGTNFRQGNIAGMKKYKLIKLIQGKLDEN